MSTGALVAVIGGPLLLAAAIGGFTFAFIRRRSGRVRERITADLVRAGAIRGPKSGLYLGGSRPYPQVSGNGRLLLAPEGVIFRILIGSDVVVPVAEITAIETDTRGRRTRRMPRRLHLFITTSRGQVAFDVADAGGWAAAVRRECARLAAGGHS
jgi:hypothetical protein